MYPNNTDDSTVTYLQKNNTVYMQRENDATEDKKGWILFVTLLGFSILVGILSTLFIICKKNQNCWIRDKKRDIENRGSDENDSLITKEEAVEKHSEKKRKSLNILKEKSTNGQKTSMEQLQEKTKAPTNDQNIKSKNKRRATAAVDLGTLYSLFAYSWESNWSIIQSKECSKKNFSSKASASLILNADQTVRAFGYEAGQIYFESDYNEEEKTEKNKNDYYFFPGFTYLLYSQNMDLASEIEDITGKKIQALSIFSMIIKNSTNSLFADISLSNLEGKISKSDVDFVLALPANCGKGAKDLMRKAAEKAGIEANHLTIVYEDEAILSYCKHLKKENRIENGYMVVGLGEGSADIVFYKEAEGGILKKLYSPTGGRSGGISFDCEYEQFLENIWHKDIIKIFAEDHIEDYLIMQREFETKIRVPSKEDVILVIPHSLHMLLEKGNPKQKIKNDEKDKKDITPDASIYKKIKYRDHKLKIPLEVKLEFFQKKVQYVVNVIKENDQSTDVKSIVIFGGLAEMNIIEHSLRERLHSDWNVFVPPTARLVVSKGALLYGHNTNDVDYT